MNVALRAIWETLGSSDGCGARWREFVEVLSAQPRARSQVDANDVGRALRSCDIGGSAGAWLAHLRRLGVIDGSGGINLERSEAVASALELAGDSFRAFGSSTGWALVATLPKELRSLLHPPPVRHTGGVLLELIDAGTSEIQLAMPFVDEAAVEYLLMALLQAGRRGARVSVVTSTTNGRKFAELVRRWPREASSELRVTEVSTHLSPLGSHAKAVVVDQTRGYVGSANLTSAGLARNIEIGVELFGPQVADLSRILSALEGLGAAVEVVRGIPD